MFEYLRRLQPDRKPLGDLLVKPPRCFVYFLSPGGLTGEFLALYPGLANESQTFAVPSTATSPTLTYYIRIDTAETTTTTAYDTATVQINGVTKQSYSNLSTPKASYVAKTIDLTSYKGTNVTLKFASSEDSSLQTSFVIDDVSTNF